MEQKQRLLRDQVLQKGYDPAKFYQYWQTLGLQFEHTDFQQLKLIVETYVRTYLEHQANTDEDQFDEFQSQTNNQDDSIVSEPHQNQNKQGADVYADFDWDLLMGKQVQKKQLSQTKKPQIKKLPKDLHKNQNKPIGTTSKTNQKSPQLKQDIKRANQPKQLKKQNIQAAKQSKTQKNINLIQTFDSSIIANNSLQQPVQTMSNQKSFTITFKQLESQSTKQKAKCLKLQQNILNHHKNVEISIINAEQLHQDSSLINKIWKGNQYLYTIKTLGRNKNRAIGVLWDVKRKYTDFEWLRNTLLRFYPGIIVPPLPPFPKSKERVSGQVKKLENFLMDAYRCPQLRNSKYFEVFLSYGNFSDFQGFKKCTESVTKPRQLSNILNMKGQVQLVYGSSIDIFSTGMHEYLQKSSQHLKNVKSILGEIKGYYDSISGCYIKLSEFFDLMSKESCEFSEEKCFPKLTETYKQIASLIAKHSQFCVDQKFNIDTFMISHFSYEKDRIDNMQNLITRRNQFVQQLGRRQPKQQSGGMFGKISSLFGQKSQSLQIPSSNYEKLLKQVGFYNGQLVNEMIRCVQVMIESQIDHFSGYGISRIDNVDKLQKTWSEILVDFSRLGVK